MHTKPKLAAFGVVALLAVLSVAMVPPARANTGLPVWVTGDYWQYSLTGASGTGISGTGTIKYAVVGTDMVTAGTATYTTYHTKMWINITSGSTTLTIPGDAWFRTSDLSPVKMTFTITLVIFGQTITSTTTAWYIPPIRVNFPLTANATWSSSTTAETETVISGQTPTWANATTAETFLVEGTVSKTVTAGTFSTTSLKATESTGAYTRSYWSWDAGNVVEQDSYDSSGSSTGSQTLQSYRYTPSATTTGGENILGLPLFAWILIVVVIVVVVALAVVMMRRKPKAPMMVPPMQPGMAPGAAPPPQPYMPPQQPPSPPQP